MRFTDRFENPQLQSCEVEHVTGVACRFPVNSASLPATVAGKKLGVLPFRQVLPERNSE
jgi:hypothetical protein